MDTDHRNFPGEEFLDLPLEPPAYDELDLGDPLHDEQEETSFLAALDDVATVGHDSSAPMIDGLEPASVGELYLAGSLHEEQEATSFLPELDDVVRDDEESSTPVIEGLLQLTDDVWGQDGGESADLVPGPAVEELAAGLAVEVGPADEDAEPFFPALPAPSEHPSSHQTARRSARQVWAGMAPRRRQAVGIAASALAAVALVGAAWVQRPEISEDVMSTGTVQTTTSVAAHRTPPAPTSTAPPATDTPAAPATDPSVAPATGSPGPPAGNNPARPAPPAPSAPGPPASPRVTPAAGAPSAPAAPAPQAPARADTTPATRAVETTAAPATTVAPAPPDVPETTETTRRFREPPTTVAFEPPTPTTVAIPENTGSVPCSPFIVRGPLACPPAEAE